MNIARNLIDYDEKTGRFTWLERGNSKAWNTRYAGKPALTATARNGYKVGSIDNSNHYAHRVAWVIVHGNIPDGMDIDHINGDKANNRISNLRLASRPSNMANCNSRVGSTSAYLGVSWSKRYQKWVSQITKDYKTILVGRFASEIEAATAYDKKALEIHGEFAKVNFPYAMTERQMTMQEQQAQMGMVEKEFE